MLWLAASGFLLSDCGMDFEEIYWLNTNKFEEGIYAKNGKISVLYCPGGKVEKIKDERLEAIYILKEDKLEIIHYFDINSVKIMESKTGQISHENDKLVYNVTSVKTPDENGISIGNKTDKKLYYKETKIGGKCDAAGPYRIAVGACNNINTNICQAYSDLSDPDLESAKRNCNSNGGLWQFSCGKDNLLGLCNYTSGDGNVDNHYYQGVKYPNPDKAREDCENRGGTWY